MNNTINDPKHEKTVKVLRIIGPIVLGIGLIFTVVGMASFFTTFGSGSEPSLFWCAFIGLPLTALGVWLTALGYMKKFGSFVASQAAPVAKDTINYVIDGTSDTISQTVNKIKKDGQNTNVICPNCQSPNPSSAKFCNSCGKPLNKVCPGCGKINDHSAQYCDHCGKKL